VTDYAKFDGYNGTHSGAIDPTWGNYQYLTDIANAAIAKFPGMRITSGQRNGDRYHHGQRQAIDIAFPPSQNGAVKYKEVADWVFETFPTQVAYVITLGQVRDRNGYSGTGKSGKWVRWPDNDHYDHLHISGNLGVNEIKKGGVNVVKKSHLIIGGHRQGDPGAGANGWNEVTYFDLLLPHIKKYAKQLKNNTITIYDTSLNMYYETQKGRGAYSMRGKYATATEFHLDSALSSAATGGHVIVGATPDAGDKRIAAVIKKYAGWHSSKKEGFSIRRDLLNLNVFFNSTTSYRLLELGFVSNKNDIDILVKNAEAIAKDMVEAITGETLSNTTTNQPSTPSTPKTAFKLGDKVKIKIALYLDSDGRGRSTSSKGKIGTIDRDVKKGKRYHVKGEGFSGWAHENDIELVVDNTYTAKKVGDTVTVQNFATHYQTGQKISNFVKGRKYKIKQVKPVNQSKSKRAYLLEGINSWVLEQDVT